MELLALGTLGIGAYMLSNNSKRQSETFVADIDALARDTRPAQPSDRLLQPAATGVPNRDDFGLRTDPALPDSERSIINVPKNYSFPRKEQLAMQRYELGNTPLTTPIYSNEYVKDKVGGRTMGTARDFKNAKGEIVDWMPEIAPRQTHTEAVIEQTLVKDAWALQPHVVRINDAENKQFTAKDALGRSVAMSPFWRSVERPRPKETFRRRVEEGTAIRSAVSGYGAATTGRAREVDMGMNRDIGGNTRSHITVTTGRNNYPSIGANPVAEYERKVDYTPRVEIAPQWSGPLTLNKTQQARSRQKSDEHDSSVTSRAGVQGNRGWRQMDTPEYAKRRLGDEKVNLRKPDITHVDTPGGGVMFPQFESRKKGLSIKDVGNYQQAYGSNVMDRYTKPVTLGLAPEASVSASIADSENGDAESFF